MSNRFRSPPAGGAFSRRFTAFAGLYFDEFDPNSAWIREKGIVRLPPLDGVGDVIVRGCVRAHPDARGVEMGAPGLRLSVNGQRASILEPVASGEWELRVRLPQAETLTLTFELT